MTGHMQRQPVSLTVAAAAAITLLAAPSALWALKLPAAVIRFEINGTAGDGGVQFFLDGEGWKSCEISRPDGSHLVTVAATISDNGSAGTNGLTELFIESAEPSFADQSLAELLALFPAGKYDYDCVTIDDKSLKGSAQLTHKLPATPAPPLNSSRAAGCKSRGLPLQAHSSREGKRCSGCRLRDHRRAVE